MSHQTRAEYQRAGEPEPPTEWGRERLAGYISGYRDGTRETTAQLRARWYEGSAVQPRSRRSQVLAALACLIAAMVLVLAAYGIDALLKHFGM